MRRTPGHAPVNPELQLHYLIWGADAPESTEPAARGTRAQRVRRRPSESPIMGGAPMFLANCPRMTRYAFARWVLRNAAAWSLASLAATALAIEDRANIEPNDPVGPERAIAWKFTPSVYHESANRSAVDLNLRGNLENDTFWIGQYRRGQEFQQTRAGYERQFAVPMGRVIVSGQYASQGFWGGSVTLEASAAAMGPYVGLLGFGRTNQRPYYNLNFDPNDSILIGGSWRPDEGTALTLYHIRDDRLGTGQRVTHMVLRQKIGARSRWTVDLFRRAGRSDADPESDSFKGNGFALTYDREPWFIRLAWDPKVNYTNSDMTRLAIGVRF